MRRLVLRPVARNRAFCTGRSTVKEREKTCCDDESTAIHLATRPDCISAAPATVQTERANSMKARHNITATMAMLGSKKKMPNYRNYLQHCRRARKLITS